LTPAKSGDGATDAQGSAAPRCVEFGIVDVGGVTPLGTVDVVGAAPLGPAAAGELGAAGVEDGAPGCPVEATAPVCAYVGPAKALTASIAATTAARPSARW
jgi:hypothetical protein